MLLIGTPYQLQGDWLVLGRLNRKDPCRQSVTHQDERGAHAAAARLMTHFVVVATSTIPVEYLGCFPLAILKESTKTEHHEDTEYPALCLYFTLPLGNKLPSRTSVSASVIAIVWPFSKSQNTTITYYHLYIAFFLSKCELCDWSKTGCTTQIDVDLCGRRH